MERNSIENIIIGLVVLGLGATVVFQKIELVDVREKLYDCQGETALDKILNNDRLKKKDDPK